LRLVNRHDNGVKTGRATGGRRRQANGSPPSRVAAALLGNLWGWSEKMLVQRQEKYEGQYTQGDEPATAHHIL
jgi:hypothetical protein